jgi:hypothetical protein
MAQSPPEIVFPGRPIHWLVAGLVFLATYVLVAAQLNYFQMQNLQYVYPRCGRVLWGELSMSMVRYFDPQQLSSMLWKVVALLPATCCLSIAVTLRYREKLDKPSLRLIRFFSGRNGVAFSLIVSTVAILLLIILVVRGNPVVDDEPAYVFQAKTYLTGAMALPPPPAAESLKTIWMIVSPVWTTKYLWGHPVFLALGMLVGSPYAATVAMALGSLILLYHLGLQITSKNEATLAVVLVGLSPWFWFTSSTLLSHVSMLFLMLLFLVGWCHLQQRPRWWLGVLLGLCLGWAFTVRPLTSVLFGIPFAFILFLNLYRSVRTWLPSLVGFVAGGIVVLSMVLYYNHVVTGSAFALPFTADNPLDSLGFGPKGPAAHSVPPYIHTPVAGLVNLVVTVMRANSWFLGWPISFLPLLGLLALSKGRENPEPVFEADEGTRPVWTQFDTFWCILVVSVCVGHILYYAPGMSETGPFYYYELLIPLSFLTAKGFSGALWYARLTGYVQAIRFIRVFAVLSVVGSILFFVPEKAIHLRNLTGSSALPFRLANEVIQDKALVFLGNRPFFGWIFGAPYPSPKLDDKIIFVRMRDEQANSETMRTFPDRVPFRLFYDWKREAYVIESYSMAESESSGGDRRAPSPPK